LIPSLANVARENLRANAPGALSGIVCYVAVVTISLKCGWGLLGIAVGMLLSAVIELALKSFTAMSWIRILPDGVPIPAQLRGRMVRFSSQSIVLMLIDLVVWNRSDVFFLKLLNSDIRQITFFSLAFNLSEKLVLIPDTLGGAMGVSVMAEYTRGRAQLRALVSTAAGYMLLLTVPLLLGMAALSKPLIETLYGARYLPVVPVLAVAALFAIPKGLRHPIEELLQAAEDQKFIILWFSVCGAVDVILDLLLIPGHGAVGAAVANGAAQALAVLGIWSRGCWAFQLSFRITGMVKICIAGLTMAMVVTFVTAPLTHWAALMTGTLVGGVVYCLVLRFTTALATEDRERFLRARRSVPAPMRLCFDGLINAVAPVREAPL
jgi:O-antigen/teichoic acid export membrane protein